MATDTDRDGSTEEEEMEGDKSGGSGSSGDVGQDVIVYQRRRTTDYQRRRTTDATRD